MQAVAHYFQLAQEYCNHHLSRPRESYEHIVDDCIFTKIPQCILKSNEYETFQGTLSPLSRIDAFICKKHQGQFRTLVDFECGM